MPVKMDYKHLVTGTPKADVISERTAAAGVTVDGVLLKDNEVSTDVINEKTPAAGVTADGVTLKDGVVVMPEGSAPTSEATNGKLYVDTNGDLHYVDDDSNDVQITTGPDVAGADTDWTVSGSDIFSGVSGNVGVGTGAGVDEKFHVAASVNGGDVAALIENSFTNTAASTDETVSLKFGFGGDNEVARISAVKLADFTSGANEDAALDFFVKRDGTSRRVMRASALVSGADETGRLLIGQDSGDPQAILHVIKSGSPSGVSGATAIFQHRQGASDDAIIALIGFDTSQIFFGDSGDTDVGKISYSHASNAFQFTVNALSPAFHIISSGAGIRVGVNATPSKTFDIRSDGTFSGSDPGIRLRASNGASDNARMQLTSGTSGICGIRMGIAANENAASVIYSNVDDDLSFRIASVDDAMVLSRFANETLVLKNDAAAGDLCGIAMRSGTDGSVIIKFGDTGSAQRGFILYSNVDESFSFATNGDATRRLVITSAGNIGMGPAIADVDELVHIARATAGALTGLLIENSTVADAGTDETAEIRFGFGGNNDAARITVGKISDYQSAANEDSFMSLSVDVGGTSTEGIRITENTGVANVGIGVTTVDEILHVGRAASGDVVALLLENTQANDAGTDEIVSLAFGFGGVNDAAEIEVGKAGDFQAGAAEDAFMRFMVANNGTLAEVMRIEGGDVAKMSFFGGTATALDTGWTTFTNLASDKTLDANATSVEEIADVLGTLIEELKSKSLISA